MTISLSCWADRSAVKSDGNEFPLLKSALTLAITVAVTFVPWSIAPRPCMSITRLVAPAGTVTGKTTFKTWPTPVGAPWPTAEGRTVPRLSPQAVVTCGSDGPESEVVIQLSASVSVVSPLEVPLTKSFPSEPKSPVTLTLTLIADPEGLLRVTICLKAM